MAQRVARMLARSNIRKAVQKREKLQSSFVKDKYRCVRLVLVTIVGLRKSERIIACS